MGLQTNVTRKAGGNVTVAFTKTSKKAGASRRSASKTRTALAKWEQEFLEQLLHAMENSVPDQVRGSNVLKKRVEEVFAIIFDMASREKPSGGTDMRKKDRPSKFARAVKSACSRRLAEAHVKTWGRVKTALMSWQQNFLEEVVDIIDDVVPGGLKGVLDNRTKFRVNKVMDLATMHMRKVKDKSHKQFKKRNNMASFGKLARSRRTASMRTALVKWQQGMLEDLMDLVDEIVPGGQMNAPRMWFRINEVMDLVWKLKAKKSKKKASVGAFRFTTASHRAAIVLTALTHWQQAFLERLVMIMEDKVPGDWSSSSNKKKIEEVFDVAFRMVAEGDKAFKKSPQETPDGWKTTRPNQYGPGKFKRSYAEDRYLGN